MSILTILNGMGNQLTLLFAQFVEIFPAHARSNLAINADRGPVFAPAQFVANALASAKENLAQSADNCHVNVNGRSRSSWRMEKSAQYNI